MGYLVPPARSVLFFICFGDSGELKASLGFTDIFFVVVLGWFFPHRGRADWGHSSVFPSCEAYMRVSPAVHSVGCQCWNWDLLFTSLM